ncbi:putative immunoglobulin E-set [Plasmopara halstedii]
MTCGIMANENDFKTEDLSVEKCVLQPPQLTKLFPNWVSASTTSELELWGDNLSAVFTTSSIDNKDRRVRLSFGGTREIKIVEGILSENGRVRCAIPQEIGQLLTLDNAISTSNITGGSPVLVDVWLGGLYNALTGYPLPLYVYQKIPVIHAISPIDGPTFGGFSVMVDGYGFIDTGNLVVRFQPYTGEEGATTEDENISAFESQNEYDNVWKEDDLSDKTQTMVTKSEMAYFDVVATYVTTERISCTAPCLPREGLYTVLVSLNTIEFSPIGTNNRFLAWRDWRNEERALSCVPVSQAKTDDTTTYDVFAHPAKCSASVERDEFERSRQQPRFTLPKKITPTATSGVILTPQTACSVDSAFDNHVENVFAEKILLEDLSRLQLPSTSWMNTYTSGRPLLSLLESLCCGRESQNILYRHLHLAFQLQTGENSFTEKSSFQFPIFVNAIRTIFPDALIRDLKELWHAFEHQADGSMTFQQLLVRLERSNTSGRRCKSPEPGPTHYHPRYSIVSSREPAAIIPPRPTESTHVVSPPSTLYMDYDVAVKTIKPRAPRSVFCKRKFTASWCNPIGKCTPEPTPPWSPSSLKSIRSQSSHRTKASKETSNASHVKITNDFQSSTIKASIGYRGVKASELPVIGRQNQADIFYQEAIEKLELRSYLQRHPSLFLQTKRSFDRLVI